MKEVREKIDPNISFQNQPDSRAFLGHLARFGGEAPSSHNTQPWLFLISDNAIEVHGNEERKLRASDPDNRQFFVSIGCAIENILVAADYYGLHPAVAYFPDPADPLYAAKISFSNFAAARHESNDHLIFEITRRTANRELFGERPIPDDFLEKIRSMNNESLSSCIVHEPAVKKEITAVAVDATVAAMRDKAFCGELSQWMKPSLSKYHDGMPGYNIGIPWPLSFIFGFVIRHGNVAEMQRKAIGKMLEKTPVMVAIATKENTPMTWLETGRTLERIWLEASKRGISMGIIAAPVQIGDFYLRLQSALKTSLRPQAFFRIGYSGTTRPKSPRLAFKDIIRNK